MRRVDNANQSAGGGSFNNYKFDFGLGNGLTKGSSTAPLKDQKPGYGSSPWSTPQAPKPAPPPQSAASSGWSGYQAGAGWSSQSTGKPSGGVGGMSAAPSETGWSAYKPMTQGLGAKPTGAGGLAFGGGRSVSMNAAAMKPAVRSGIAGVVQPQSKGDDVFWDLLDAALNRSNSSVPLNAKSAPKPPFAMGNLDTVLPKAGEQPLKQQQSGPVGRKTPPPPPAAAAEAQRSTQSSAERDPFPYVGASSSATTYEDDIFSFPNGVTGATPAPASKRGSQDDPFGLSGGPEKKPGAAAPQRPPPPARATPVADPFDVFNSTAPTSASRRVPADPLDALLSKSTSSRASAAAPPPPAQDDGWGVFGDSGGSSSGGNEPTTTELEGLPPPPNGVTAKAANDKGSEFYKNGQFPDAIKWLSWSIELLRSSPNSALMEEVLTCRVSCFKEIGEMKKAVSDCSKAIELQPSSTALIMLRANLYESMEKYKLGVADLRLVLKIDPDHRLARSTLTRLERMIGK